MSGHGHYIQNQTFEYVNSKCPLNEYHIYYSPPSLLISIRVSIFLINSLPNHNFVDWSNMKAFADDKINVTEKLKLIFGTAENIVGKGESAGYQHFLLFPQCFQKASFSRSFKVGIVR